MINRRNFLGSVLAAGAVGLVAPRSSRAAESSVEILINEPIGKILPDGKELTLTAVHPDAKNARETEVNVRGARVMEARARVLSATDIHAHNSFTNPRGLEPRDEKVNVGSSGQLVYRFQPASVTRLQLTLG